MINQFIYYCRGAHEGPEGLQGPRGGPGARAQALKSTRAQALKRAPGSIIGLGGTVRARETLKRAQAHALKREPKRALAQALKRAQGSP